MFTLYVDEAKWQAQLKACLSEYPGLVPVAKGNGYGFGMRRLARAAAEMGCDTIAVGSMAEAHMVTANGNLFDKIIVLTPHLPGDSAAGSEENIVRTVASVASMRRLAGQRVVVDCMTSLHRHGITHADLPALVEAAREVSIDGFALHMPLTRPWKYDPATEVNTWLTQLTEAGLSTKLIYVSHLTTTELAKLAADWPATTFRPRIGTALWLGDRSAFAARGRVLDVVPLRRGQRYGYRQQLAWRAGHLVVVAGGTAHGVGMEAPKAMRGLTARAKLAAIAGLASLNRTLSPFTWAGKQRWFAEPPHMLVSLLWLPASVEPPAVGDELPAAVRMTTTHVDVVVEQ